MDFMKTEDLFRQLDSLLSSLVKAKKLDDRKAISQDMQRIMDTLYIRSTGGLKYDTQDVGGR